MTAPNAAAPTPAEEPTTAVATVPSAAETAESKEVAKIGIGDLPPEIRAGLAAAKVANAVAAEISKLSWGRSLDGNAARAIAEWGRVHNVDVITEMDVLGGRPYLNARYYLRRLAGLIEKGLVEYAVADHIERDPRLDPLAAAGHAGAKAEIERRQMARIEYQIPECAESAVVFRVKLKSMAKEVVGAKWAGGKGKSASGKEIDPVGEAYPVETAESRAARRCVRQLVGHVPALAEEAEVIERDAIDVSDIVESAKESVAEQIREHRKIVGQRPLAAEGY